MVGLPADCPRSVGVITLQGIEKRKVKVYAIPQGWGGGEGCGGGGVCGNEWLVHKGRAIRLNLGYIIYP